MKLFVFAILFVNIGCANADYGGVNYGQVIAPDGETWKVVSGKDETNIHFKLTRGDVTAEYTAEASTATQALKAALEATTNALVKTLEVLASARP